jgi:thiol:disulfide interchange protein DsbC
MLSRKEPWMHKYLAAVLLFCSISSTAAADSAPAQGGECVAPTLQEANRLLNGVGEVLKVEPSPVKGLWLMELRKDERHAVVFMDCARKNLIAGTIFPIPEPQGDKKPAAPFAKKERVDVGSIPLGDSIVLGNPKAARRLFVFTDPDCPYCQRLHGELKKLAAAEPDLAIYVKMFPLKIHPGAYDKARALLVAGSPEALDIAFAGGPLPPAKGDEKRREVDETLKVAASLGVSAAPALVFPDGRVMLGYRDADMIRKFLSVAL